MRFVAGRGAVAELLAGSAMAKRMAVLWQRAIGKLLLARGAVAERLQRGGAMTELLLARALQRSSIGKKPLLERGDTAGKGRYCWKGEPLQERRATAGNESHCWKGKERSATAGKKGLQGATGWSLFLMRPLCKLFLYL